MLQAGVIVGLRYLMVNPQDNARPEAALYGAMDMAWAKLVARSPTRTESKRSGTRNHFLASYNCERRPPVMVFRFAVLRSKRHNLF